MNKRLLLACAAVMALSVQLAACDNDQPQAPQLEDSSVAPVAPDEGLASADQTRQDGLPESDIPNIVPSVSAPADAVEGDSMDSAHDAVLPGEIADENIPPPPSREDFTDGSCDYELWVGTTLDEATIKGEGRPYRILKPGDAMTMDHNPDRINVEHEDGTVSRVWCG